MAYETGYVKYDEDREFRCVGRPLPAFDCGAGDDDEDREPLILADMCGGLVFFFVLLVFPLLLARWCSQCPVVERLGCPLRGVLCCAVR